MSLTRYTISDKELAYIAGFIDGEGYIGINGRTFSLVVNVTNTVKEPLEFIQRIFGGDIRMRPPRNRRRAIYDWKIFGANAAEVLQSLLPYLIVKKEQALLGIELMLVSSKDEKANIALKIRNLKLPQIQ